jgi:tRNA dimethylallyltransferase
MKLVFVQGVTGAGKSSLALHLAQVFGGAIINCDSIQCYQRVDIGSAKPSRADYQKAPHFLFDQVAPPNEWTVGDYHRAFLQTLSEISQSFKVAFVVGGTGFYFQAVEKGLFQVPASTSELRSQLEREVESATGQRNLFSELEKKDPEAAKSISINDKYRLVRFIEILRTSQQTVSSLKAEQNLKTSALPYPILKLGLSLTREELQPLLFKRILSMLEEGWVKEVESLCNQGLTDWAPLKSVGYREIVTYLQAEQRPTLSQLQEQLLTSHLQLAKKQRTWFKRDHQVSWVQGLAKQQVEQQVESFLNFNKD